MRYSSSDMLRILESTGVSGCAFWADHTGIFTVSFDWAHGDLQGLFLNWKFISGVWCGHTYPTVFGDKIVWKTVPVRGTHLFLSMRELDSD